MLIRHVGPEKAATYDVEVESECEAPRERAVEPEPQKMVRHAGDHVARLHVVVAERRRQALAGLERRPREAVAREPAEVGDLAVGERLDTLAARAADVAKEAGRPSRRHEEDVVVEIRPVEGELPARFRDP